MEKKKIELLIKSLNVMELICFGVSVTFTLLMSVLLLLLGEYLYAALALASIVLIAVLFKLDSEEKISPSQWYKVTCILLPLALFLSILMRSVTLFFLALVMYCSQDINRLEQNQENTRSIRRIKFDKAIMMLSCIALFINLFFVLK